MVIACVFDIRCGKATIRVNVRENEAGHTDIPFDGVIVEDWVRIDKFHRTEDVALRARIMSVMAGAVAEEECLGDCAGGDRHDQTAVWQMLDELAGIGDDPVAIRARLLRMTQRLVRRHRKKIETFAAALCTRQTITGVNHIRTAAGLPLARRRYAQGFLSKKRKAYLVSRYSAANR